MSKKKKRNKYEQDVEYSEKNLSAGDKYFMSEEDAVEYLASIGVPIGPDGMPLGIGWDD